MAYIIRCQTNQGMHRLSFPSKSATFSDLQSAIEKKYNIDPDAQVISRTRPNAPEFIENVAPSASLKSIGLNHGAIIYLIMVENQVKQYKSALQKEQAQSKEEQKDWKPPSSSSGGGGSALKPMPKRKAKSMSKRLDDLKNEEDDVVDAGPKHIPFHEYIEERQRKFAKSQPWNIDPPKYDYTR